ncbi:MAG TPA: hypothetical protein VEY51_21535 [Chondromyces sp.]|nr:hypothetical protein [Chondromyces sp.]
MSKAHFKHWPKRLPYSLRVPETSIYDNLKVSARRYPNGTAIHYYGNQITYKRLLREVDALAGFLQEKL